MNRPRIAVSACLLGHRVRYDGNDQYLPWLADLFPCPVEYLAICPEVAIGLGVPRRPIERRRIAGEIRLVDRQDAAIDHGPAMTAHAVDWLTEHPDIQGLILKARSPSCGLGSTPIIGTNAQEYGDGLFAEHVRRQRPNLPVIDDAGLADNAQRRAFIEAVLSMGCMVVTGSSGR